MNTFDCGEVNCEYCSKDKCVYMKGDFRMDEMRKLKAKLAHEMDIFVRERIDDEDSFDVWLRDGVPDGADEDYLYNLLECPGVWKNICECFGKICEAAGIIKICKAIGIIDESEVE